MLPDSERKAQQPTFFSVCHSRRGCEPELREDVAHEVGARLFSSLTAHVGSPGTGAAAPTHGTECVQGQTGGSTECPHVLVCRQSLSRVGPIHDTQAKDVNPSISHSTSLFLTFTTRNFPYVSCSHALFHWLDWCRGVFQEWRREGQFFVCVGSTLDER